MSMEHVRPWQADPEVEAYIRKLIVTQAHQYLPELFRGTHPDALYHVSDRQGVSVIALATNALTDDQLRKIMTYRLVQYLTINFLDVRVVYEARMAHEPLSNVSPHDVHFIAAAVDTGEILCYAVMEAVEAPPGVTLRTRERPLLPVEELHGWGVYNRLRILPDLSLAKVREGGRFAKNQRLDPALADLGVRAPVEIMTAFHRALLGPLWGEVEAIVLTVEEGVVKRNYDFFHIPTIIIHGTVPYVPEGHWGFPSFQYRSFYPMAYLCSDLTSALPRMAAIEQALALPGKQGLLALFALKRDIQTPWSSLEPPQGLPPLTDANLPQRNAAMSLRGEMLTLGEQLRTLPLFSTLSVAEATVLGTFMERRAISVGEVIIRRGGVGDALFLIESGQADVRVRTRVGTTLLEGTLGPGDYFGEIALVTGEAHTADVVALTPMTLLRLSKEDYMRYLAPLVEVDQQVPRPAGERARSCRARALARW